MPFIAENIECTPEQFTPFVNYVGGRSLDDRNAERARITQRFKDLFPLLTERGRRFYIASEAHSYGRGGASLLHDITGMTRTTIKLGQQELAVQNHLRRREELNPSESINNRFNEAKSRIRRPGAGRKPISFHYPNFIPCLEKLVDPSTKGDPESTNRWMITSMRSLSDELSLSGIIVSQRTVWSELNNLGYRLKVNSKNLHDGIEYPDRDEQFNYINQKISVFSENNNPIISIDTKKK
jgi:hypothetical protein